MRTPWLSAKRIVDEKVLSLIRCKFEHVFHRINVQLRYKKVRRKGLAKNTACLTMQPSIANMFIKNYLENLTRLASSWILFLLGRD